MNKTGSYQRLGAWAVLFIFLAGWSLGALHQLLSHHAHSERPECSANYDPRATHLHDERYANEHCSLCEFLLSTPELLSISAILAVPRENPSSKDSFHCTPTCTRIIHDTTCLRGPPVL